MSETVSHQCLQHSGWFVTSCGTATQSKRKGNCCIPQNDGQKGEKIWTLKIWIFICIHLAAISNGTTIQCSSISDFLSVSVQFLLSWVSVCFFSLAFKLTDAQRTLKQGFLFSEICAYQHCVHSRQAKNQHWYTASKTSTLHGKKWHKNCWRSNWKYFQFSLRGSVVSPSHVSKCTYIMQYVLAGRTIVRHASTLTCYLVFMAMDYYIHIQTVSDFTHKHY